MQSVNPFELNIGRLTALVLEFEKRVEEGLAENGRELICMPTYIPSIRLPDSGTAYVIDLGGTNVRAATVSFRKGSCIIDRGPSEVKMPWERDTLLENHRYLDIQAKALVACIVGHEMEGKTYLNLRTVRHIEKEAHVERG